MLLPKHDEQDRTGHMTDDAEEETERQAVSEIYLLS